MDRGFVLTIVFSNCNIQYFFISLLNQKLFFHLKGSTLWPFFGICELPYHYTCNWGPLLSKIKATETETPRYCDRRSDNRDSQGETVGSGHQQGDTCCTKPRFPSQAGQVDGTKFHHAAKDGAQFKTQELLNSIIFPFNIFEPCSTTGNCNQGPENCK